MMSPLHAWGIVRPGLTKTAFGTWRDGNAPRGWGVAATLDVLRGWVYGFRPQRPMPFPYPGAQLPLSSSNGLDMCGPGPAGPVSFFFFPQNPVVTGFVIRVNGVDVAPCVVTSTNFVPASGDATVWRTMLAADGAVMMFPLRPVPIGATVQVVVATAQYGDSATWYTVRDDRLIGIPVP